MDQLKNPQPAKAGQGIRNNSLGSDKPLRSPFERSNSLAPSNDWAYKDRGPSPEKMPTKERVTAGNQSATLTPVSGISEDGEYALDDVKPTIYQTRAGRTRAKIPDKEDETVGDASALGNGVTQPDHSNGGSSSRRRSRWRDLKATKKGAIMMETREGRPILRHVMLHWRKAGDQGLLLNAKMPEANVKSQIQSQNYVSWQHSHIESMTLKRFEDSVIETKAQGVQESEIGLTRRLLKRVRLESERPFVGGNFLIPRALRYDSLDSSRYSADKCCIFLAFPYFAVAREQPRKAMEKYGEEHSTRSLLQSVYRLNDTKERDQSQSIRMLARKNLISCIEADESDISEISRHVKEELIYVPQLWALILGLDRLMTFGALSIKSLQGRDIEVREEASPGTRKRCYLVRIRFRNQRRVEDLTYPIEQCACWFGLVNKQQQIRGVLTKERETSDPKKYKLQVHGQVIEARTWTSIQRSTKTEVLDLWMETPKQKVPEVSVKSPEAAKCPGILDEKKSASDQTVNEAEAGSSGVASQEPDNQEQDESGTAAGYHDASPCRFERLEEIPIVSPFLEWRIIDETGDEDEIKIDEKIDRFLHVIYRALPATVDHRTDRFMKNDISKSKSPSVRLPARRKKPSIGRKTSQDVLTELMQITAIKPKEVADLARDVNMLSSQILRCFISKEHEPQGDPMEIFWGAVYEVISQGSQSYLEDLLERLKIIRAWVEHIHLGVYYSHIESAPGGREVEKHAISEGAILLSSIVDACGAIFSLFVEAVDDVMGSTKQPRCGKKVCKSFNEALNLLETARDELIVEASGVATGEHIGPVLTPEAILIMHIERLVCGVYRDGNVDIISILEECLERLSLKVRYRYSRRLLQMINGFEEEVTAVHDVLLHQKRVLGELRGYLQPSSFDTPSIARSMRFDFEKRSIERILMTIREQLKNCTELQERAKVLAVQNVHLVETLQDDNGRAIFIFTFITILFLPLSFVAGFFGMNLKGINGTTSDASLFWKIAVPFTGGIMLLCTAVIIWGEKLWFGIASMRRSYATIYRKYFRKGRKPEP